VVITGNQFQQVFPDELAEEGHQKLKEAEAEGQPENLAPVQTLQGTGQTCGYSKGINSQSQGNSSQNDSFHKFGNYTRDRRKFLGPD
jgi:hypothetical protein